MWIKKRRMNERQTNRTMTGAIRVCSGITDREVAMKILGLRPRLVNVTGVEYQIWRPGVDQN